MLNSENNSENRPPGYDFDNENRPPLEKNQKIAIGVLAVFGFFVMYFWFVQFQNNLTGKTTKGQEKSAETVTDETYEADLRTKDSDGDGITDWEELNLYGTSPYLEDSDSDGVSDKKEIDQGTDPNCPVGKSCVDEASDLSDNAGGNSLVDSELSEIGSLLESLSGQSSLNGTSSSTIGNSNSDSSSPTGSDGQNGQISAAALRQLLQEYGMTKAMLDNFTDKELMDAYGNTLSGMNDN